MGATGNFVFRKSDGSADRSRAFGIAGGVRLDSNPPRESGLDRHGQDDIMVSVHSEEGKDIIFQFKLVGRNQDKMSIKAYDPNVPSKGKVQVVTDRPSLDAVINNPNTSATDKSNAMRIRDMMNRTRSGIKESSLTQIANNLKANKNRKGRK